MGELTLTKYEGLGNDFLVLVDADRTMPYDAMLAQALCDRHRGIGADGLLRLSGPRHGGDVFMELRNADGSVAETSGNGLRCAALAAMDAKLVEGPIIEIETIAGMSRSEVLARNEFGDAQVRVDMGQATVERCADFDMADRRAYAVNIGNPHLVLLGRDPDDLVITAIGPDLEIAVPGGQNVELATIGAKRDVLVIDTWERGAGFTLACGSGSCASAAAARSAGLIGDSVTVKNPGGEVTVGLAGTPSSPTAVLSGPARHVFTVQFSARDLASLTSATDEVP